MKLITLSEALATGRPFKKPSWTTFIEPNERRDIFAQLVDDDFFEPVWQVQEEEKPPMRVLISGMKFWVSGDAIRFCKDDPSKRSVSTWEDLTPSLAAALAPYIKKELKL